ncbi:MAG TPA: NUDIX hydrolase [Taishania sp.]|nr:NUDIX hydrolase [Taishania sp.]
MGYIPSIFVTVDIVLFRFEHGVKQILLIQRMKDPYKDCWALPGGFVDRGEDLEDAAKRELQEETNIVLLGLKQLKAYGKPDRDPRGHTVSIAFVGELMDDQIAIAQDDAKSLAWFSVDELPQLAFDHDQIVQDALNQI